MNVSWLKAGLTVAGAALLAACAQGRIVHVTVSPPPPFSAERGEDWARADSLWEERRSPEAAWAALVAYRRAAEEQPKVPELWTRYARACHFVATYIETRQRWSNPERRRALYLEGARAAENGLRLHPDFATELAETGDEARAIHPLHEEWLKPAFWLVVNRGRQALTEGARARVVIRPDLEPLVRSVLARDATLEHGGLHRFLGVMYAVVPESRDTDSARAHFARAERVAPLYFATRTLQAEHLATLENDTASFRALLEWVVNTPADTLPEAAIENEFEQARARALLAEEAELFGE